jgi:6-phosphogluconolactonase
VGTYTEGLAHVAGHAPGIFQVSGAGDARPAGVTRNPSWIATSRAGDRVYAVAETREFEGSSGGGLVAFRRSSRALVALNTASSGGFEPTHLKISDDEKFLVVANYGDGVVAVFALEQDGRIGERTCLVRHTGSSLNPVRQSGPHPHHVAMDPITGEIIVTDLGLDALVVYQLTVEGRLVERVDGRITMEPGSGPRHLAFTSDGSCIVVVGELDNSASLLRRGKTRFETTRGWSTVPPAFSGASAASAIQLDADDRFAYVANRGHDSIAIIDITGMSDAPLTFVSCAGRTPRDLLLGVGACLYVANQDSDSVAIFEIDNDGVPEQAGMIEIPSPACVVEVGREFGGLERT